MKKMRFLTGPVLFLCLLLLLPPGALAEPKASDYLLPEGDERVYDLNELKIMPAQVVCYAKNEIYARHGRKFVSEELQGYFNEQTWYRGTIEPGDFSESLLSETEKENIALLAELENRLSPGGYELDDPCSEIDYSGVYEYTASLYGFNVLNNLAMYGTAATTIVESDYFSLLVPSYGTWDLEAEDSRTFRIYYVPARESGYEGGIVSIRAFEWTDQGYENYPHWAICGLSNDRKYVAIFPTDVRFDPEDRVQAEEYGKFYQWSRTLSDEDAVENNSFTAKDGPSEEQAAA